MENKGKILQLVDGEELTIIGPNNKSNLRIVCNDNTLVVEEQINQHLTPNIQINNISFADIKRFVLFESYYQNSVGEDINDELKNENNKIMDYHMDRIYGKNNKDLEIVDTDFQCITYYE